jgi:hypothetical protein
VTLYVKGYHLSWDLGILAGGGQIGFQGTDLHGESVHRVTDVSGPAQAGVARLQEMMAAPEDVVIIDVASDFVVPGVNPPTPISQRGGGAVGSAPADPPLWAVWIDGGRCFGQGYYVYASMWKAVDQYLPIILGHELAHISHHIHGIQTSEPLATMAENVHRAELGLPLRSVTKYAGGCGDPPSWLPPWLEELAASVMKWVPYAEREREQMRPETPGRIPDELFPRRRAPDD